MEGGEGRREGGEGREGERGYGKAGEFRERRKVREKICENGLRGQGN